MNFRPGLFTFIAGAALVFASCKPKDTSVLDDNSFNTPAPHIDVYIVNPDTLDTSTLPPATNLPTDSVTVNLTMFVTLAPDTPPASIANAMATVTNASGDTLVRTTIHNDGAAPDAIANDSIFSAAINFKIERKQVGIYRVAAAITNTTNDKNGAEIGIQVINAGNHAPVIATLVAPDTVSVPTDSTVKTYVLSVHASDAEGLDDIFSVNADAYDTSNHYVNTLVLKDDGKTAVDGDAIAGDGIYSVLLPVDSSYKGNAPYTYYFYATDRSGAKSDTLTKVVYAR